MVPDHSVYQVGTKNLYMKSKAQKIIHLSEQARCSWKIFPRAWSNMYAEPNY